MLLPLKKNGHEWQVFPIVLSLSSLIITIKSPLPISKNSFPRNLVYSLIKHSVVIHDWYVIDIACMSTLEANEYSYTESYKMSISISL